MNPFTLTLDGGYGEVYLLGDLASPVLDPELFATQTVRVAIDTEHTAAEKKRPPKVVLNDFILLSLNSFLGDQLKIREVVRAELARDRQNWRSRKSVASEADVLSKVKVCSLRLRRRQGPSPVLIGIMQKKNSPEKLADYMASCDKPETMTAFALEFEVPWDNEHHVVISFRDGDLIGIAHE